MLRQPDLLAAELGQRKVSDLERYVLSGHPALLRHRASIYPTVRDPTLFPHHTAGLSDKDLLESVPCASRRPRSTSESRRECSATGSPSACCRSSASVRASAPAPTLSPRPA